MARQTIKQFKAQVISLGKKQNLDIHAQTNIWPWPQAEQSEILFWLPEWKACKFAIPESAVRVALNACECCIKGFLVHVADGAPTPAQTVAEILAVNVIGPRD